MATTPYSPRTPDRRAQPSRRSGSITRNVARAASVAAAAYGTYLVAAWAYERWWIPSRKQSTEQDKPSDVNTAPTPRELRRADRIAEWCRVESDRAFSELLPALRKAIESRTDSSDAARLLKRLRSAEATAAPPNRSETSNQEIEDTSHKEKQLWEAIKTRVLAGMICTCYAHTLLLLLLRVELFVLGRRLLFHHAKKQSIDEDSAGEDDIEPDPKIKSFALRSYEFVLQYTLDRFLEETVPRLVDKINTAIQTGMGHWDVAHESSMEMTRQDFHAGIMQARAIIEATTDGDKSQTGVLSGFIVQSDSSLATDVPDELAVRIIQEAWDILESPAWDSALQDALNVAFGSVLQGDTHKDSQGLYAIFSDANQMDSSPKALPLASIIAHVRTIATEAFYSPQGNFPNRIVPSVLLLRSVEDLTNASFCSQE